MRTGGYSTPEERPNSFYPIFYSEETGDICLNEKPNYIKILPVDSEGKYRVWRKTQPSLLTHLANNEIRIVKRANNVYKVQIIDRIKEGVRPKSMWVGSKYDASSHGTKYIKSLFGESALFSFPKSVHAVRDTLFTVVGESPDSLVLDIFGGSGTTGDAVIQLNREDNGDRKYILVEMGEYFNSVTLPRIKKIIYSTEWKNGKPSNITSGIPQIIKYMRLESYEDALSNITLEEKDSFFGSNLGDEYLIGYMLDMEAKGSLLNLDAFISPFEYNMKITEKNECKERRVDVVETFNYLIGLSVHSQSSISYFSTKEAVNPPYEGAVDLQKDLNGVYGFRQIEGTLPDGRKALIIWRNINQDNILASNAALDAYFSKYRINPADREFDVIYIMGITTLRICVLTMSNGK